MSQGHERLFGGMDWYLLHEYTSISWFCSSSQWGLKPRHPEQLMSEAAEKEKKIVEEKQMGGRKRGDTRAKGGGYREEKEPENWWGARWPLSVQWIQFVRATQQSPFQSLAFPSLARCWYSMSRRTKCPKQLTETADVADEQTGHHAGGVGEKVLVVITAAQESSGISCLFYPASQKGQRSHLHANRGLEL